MYSYNQLLRLIISGVFMKRLLLILLCAAPAFAVDLCIEGNGLFVPSELGALSIIKRDTEYVVVQDEKEHKVFSTDTLLSTLNKKQLAAFLMNGGYIAVNKCLKSNEYILRSKGRMNGGGPVLGAVAYWTTKVTGYASIAILCAYDPLMLVELPVMTAGVESAATGAGALGLMAPTP
jgi:hypothetical protein